MTSEQFLKQLPPLCWSPRPAHTYTLNGKGIGKIAYQHLAAWNLIHDKYDWSLWQSHVDGVAHLTRIRLALAKEHNGAPLADTVLALGPKRWPAYAKRIAAVFS